MTAPSPVQASGSVVSFTIIANGKPLDSAIQVVSIDVWTAVNKLTKVRLVVSDGSAAEETFPISETDALIPGAALTVSLGYDGHDTLVFSGVIYRQGLDVTQNGPSRLVVEATDTAMAMTLARQNAIYEGNTDSQVIEKLLSSRNLTKQVTVTTAAHPIIVQYYCTDWDLLLIRAQLNGMVVTIDSGTVTVAPPDTSQDPALTLTYGDSILDFRADMDASTQLADSAVQSFAWDPATQALLTSNQATAKVTEPGNISSAQLAKVFNVSTYAQQTGGSLDQSELTAWSSAELLMTRLAKIRGQVRYQGSTLAKVGSMVTLAGLGDRFNGNAYVSGLHHNVADGLWRSSAEIGLSPEWFAAAAPHVAAPGASGQLPPVSNVQTGIVMKVDADPDGEFRVQVRLPLLQAGTAGVWARLGSFYASNGFGAEFYPEIGDEVLLAFMNDDPRFPVILGGVYSKKNPPPVPPDADNKQKAIVTRSQLRIDFFEDKQAVEISTPGGHSIRLDDDAKSVTIKDLNGNKATFATGGITLDSATHVTVKAQGDVAITAQGNLALKANANVTVQGLQIQAKADATLAMQAAADAKLTSSGMLTIEGAIVKIN